MLDEYDRKISADSLAFSGYADYFFTINKAPLSALKLILNDVSPYDSSDYFSLPDTLLRSSSSCATNSVYNNYYTNHYTGHYFSNPQHNTTVYEYIFANDSNRLGYFVTKNGVQTYHSLSCKGAPVGDTSIFYLNY